MEMEMDPPTLAVAVTGAAAASTTATTTIETDTDVAANMEKTSTPPAAAASLTTTKAETKAETDTYTNTNTAVTAEETTTTLTDNTTNTAVEAKAKAPETTTTTTTEEAMNDTASVNADSNTNTMTISGTQLWEMIDQGKKFLTIMEAFAKSNFPRNNNNQNENEVTFVADKSATDAATKGLRRGRSHDIDLDDGRRSSLRRSTRSQSRNSTNSIKNNNNNNKKRNSSSKSRTRARSTSRTRQGRKPKAAASKKKKKHDSDEESDEEDEEDHEEEDSSSDEEQSDDSVDEEEEEEDEDDSDDDEEEDDDDDDDDDDESSGDDYEKLEKKKKRNKEREKRLKKKPKFKFDTNKSEIVQYCANTGEELYRYPNLKIAADRLAEMLPGENVVESHKKYPLTIRKGIRNILNFYLNPGKSKTVAAKRKPSYKNYYFRYAQDIYSPMPTFPITKDETAAEKGTNKKKLLSLLNSAEKKRKRNKKVKRSSSVSQRRKKKPRVMVESDSGSESSDDQDEDELEEEEELQVDFGYVTAASSSPQRKQRKRSGRKVLQYCAKSGELLKCYDNVCHAARAMAISPINKKDVPEQKLQSRIRTMCSRGQLKPLFQGKLYFRYMDDTRPLPVFPMFEDEATNVAALANKDLKHRKKAIFVYCAQTGKFLVQFNTARSAVKSLVKIYPQLKKLPPTARCISNILNKEDPTPYISHRGFYFRFANDTTSPMPKFPIPLSKRQLGDARKLMALSVSRSRGKDEDEDNDDGVDVNGEENSGDSGDDDDTNNNTTTNTNTITNPNISSKGRVLVYSAQTGTLYGTFDTCRDASRKLVGLAPHITAPLNACRIYKYLNGKTTPNDPPFYKDLYFRHELDNSAPMPTFPITTTNTKMQSQTQNGSQEQAKNGNNNISGGNNFPQVQDTPIEGNKGGEMNHNGIVPTNKSNNKNMKSNHESMDIDNNDEEDEDHDNDSDEGDDRNDDNEDDDDDDDRDDSDEHDDDDDDDDGLDTM